jgi:hypothetical protein
VSGPEATPVADTQTPAVRAVPSPTPAGWASPYEDTGNYGSVQTRTPIGSLTELVQRSSLVVVATVVRQLEDYWAPVDPEIEVYSRFVLRVDRVVAGDASEGDELVVFFRGGETLQVGNPQPGGSFKPIPGRPTVVMNYAGMPFFKVGLQEVVFLWREAREEWGVEYYSTIPEGRYWERDGLLASVRPGLLVANALIPDGSYLKDIVGASLVEFEARVKAVAQNAVP